MKHQNPYLLLACMFAIHVALMYILMYAMVNTSANILPNNNQFYMAILMASPMLVLELMLMRSIYPNNGLNFGIVVLGILLLAGSFFLIRGQVAIGDREFLRSMIPHHAGAILMCEEADLSDPQVRELCTNIISSQRAEIDWMKAKLEVL